MFDDAPLAGFDQSSFEHDAMTHEVYRGGSGPAVVVIHEMPGLHRGVIGFGRRLIDHGFTVYLPSLFGTPGRPYPHRTVAMLPVILRACVSREFTVLADRTSRVNSWLLALARRAHTDCGGSGVGAIGMCFTGSFALAMAIDDAVLAPVLSQPFLPARQKGGLGLDGADLVRVKERTAQDLCVMGLRFTRDRMVPAERFQRMRQEFGEAFMAIEIDSSPGNSHGITRDAHSVLTEDLVDEPGHPTREALDRVLEFLSERLNPPTR
jgi:dienelactone hydrolase